MEGMRYTLGIWLFLLILLSHIDVFPLFFSLSLFWAFHCSAKMKSFRVGANDRLRKHILFCRKWQRLSCYLNNMSSAEMAWKHYLGNCVWLNSGMKLQPSPTIKDPRTVEVKVIFHWSCNITFFPSSFSIITLQAIDIYIYIKNNNNNNYAQRFWRVIVQ